jgi:hypothetical protein
MWFIGGAVALIIEALAVALLRSGWREWRNVGGPPRGSARMRRFKDRAGRSGMDRGGLVLGFSFACFGVMIGVGGVIDWKQPNMAAAWVFIVTMCGFFLSIALYWLIVSFNRPKFLVPPQHRGEPGAFAAAWRQRRGQRQVSSEAN